MANRVCFYVYGFPPDFSGATTQAIKLAGMLETKGYIASFISYTYNKKILKHPTTNTFPVKRFFRPCKSMVLYHINALKALFAWRKKFNIIYINGNDGQFWTACYLLFFGKFFGKKIFMEINMDYSDPLSIEGTALSLLKKHISTWMDGYICLSSIIFERMTILHPSLNSRCIYNGVDTTVFRLASSENEKNAIRTKLGLNGTEKIVVTCGAICKRKGIDFLLNVWKRVLNSIDNVNVKILFIGPFQVTDGEMDNFASTMLIESKRKEFSDSVIFCGEVHNVDEYFRVADLFVFAGRQEGSPNVLREAMASGLPIITLELKGITDDMIQNEKNGILIPVEDQERLRNYLETEISDPIVIDKFVNSVTKILYDNLFAKKLSQAARKTAVEKFTLKQQAEYLISFFEEC